ncbi:hypothetical protein KZX46_00345 (plasmid) [Polymorphobacter sp. PAMC 29334]|uniref:putative quinol monooxygenase n=1 Tax=Polymorphobacter sp. PAMC 29334 TaxID=2862331 RepID=UPI001C778DAE|nr:antibiotic biosynthesis monooxygenase [Polymorphobacter sp. PAMC 29334]QYE33295.1 hypothetical protein KZX46_00345 [Polymorphobacter sp. PAMC 29334]
MTGETQTPAIIITAKYVHAATDAAAFKVLASRMAADAQRRPACIFLNAAEDVDCPSIFHLTEAWASESGFAEHASSEAFQAVLKDALTLRILQRSGTMFTVSGAQALEMPS